jgi:hypothetical protein
LKQHGAKREKEKEKEKEKESGKIMQHENTLKKKNDEPSFCSSSSCFVFLFSFFLFFFFLSYNFFLFSPLLSFCFLPTRIKKSEKGDGHVLPRNRHLLHGSVAGEINDLHAVEQRARDRFELVGRAEEKHLGHVHRHVQVVVEEVLVLLGVEQLKQRRGRIAVRAFSARGKGVKEKKKK